MSAFTLPLPCKNGKWIPRITVSTNLKEMYTLLLVIHPLFHNGKGICD